jgi:hypothetical protein
MIGDAILRVGRDHGVADASQRDSKTSCRSWTRAARRCRFAERMISEQVKKVRNHADHVARY